MEKIKLGAPDVFMTFGLGALFFISLMFPLPILPAILGSGEQTVSVSKIAELWVPITAALIFALHAVGSLMVILGNYPLSKLSKDHTDAERVFYKLADSVSDRLWAVVIANRMSRQFASGLAGICIVHLLIASVDFLRWLGEEKNHLTYEMAYLPIFFGSLISTLFYSSSLELKLIGLDTAIQVTSLKSNLRPASEPNE
jgi:hypothetical protein